MDMVFEKAGGSAEAVSEPGVSAEVGAGGGEEWIWESWLS